jgi:hypothetical protein
MHLFHISEDPDIQEFTPRPPRAMHQNLPHAVVWAVSDAGLWAYLVPRDCPRIAFYATDTTQAADIERFLDGEPEKRVMAVEAGWLERCLSTMLYRYEFADDNFILFDRVAHYFVSPQIEQPIARITIPNPAMALVGMGAELRIMPELWELRERVFRSSLAWSVIRMRNATPPRRGYTGYLPVS